MSSFFLPLTLLVLNPSTVDKTVPWLNESNQPAGKRMGTVAVDLSLDHFLSNGLNFLHFLPLFLNSPQVCL